MSRLHTVGPLGRMTLATFLGLSVGWPLVRAADITWTLDGNGSWHDAVNWSSNPALPGAADGVTIDVGGGNLRIITHGKDDDTIASLTSSESLRVTGGSLSVSGKTTLAADGDIYAIGAGVSFEAAGPVDFDGASLVAQQGGKMNLSSATSYSASANVGDAFYSQHADSELDLSGITTLNGGGVHALQVFATAGGSIDLSNLPSLDTGAVDFRSEGAGSQIDLGSLTGFASTGSAVARLWARDGGKVLSPNLATIIDVDIRVEGASSQLDLGKLTNVDQTNITAAGGGQIALPLVTAYTGPTAYNGLLQASGPNSLLDLSDITSFAGGASRNTQVFANGGGKVDLGNLPSINGGATDVRSEGQGSVVDFSALTSFTHTGGDVARLWARDGGKVLSPNLTSIVDVEIRVEGAGSQLDLGKLTNVDQTNITAVNGGKLALPLVTGYTGPTTYNGLLQASGAGALLDLSTFTSFAGGNGRSTFVWANGGGKVDLGNLPTIDGGATDVRSEGQGSVVDFSALTSFTHTGGDFARLWARDGGKVLSPNLTSIVDVDIRVEGAGSQLDLGKLTNVDQTNITAVNGGKLALPLVTGYTGPTTYNGLLQASGAGALLDLTTFTSFAGGNGRSTFVWANGGGKVDLGNVPQINGGATDVRSEGQGSVVDFSALTSFTHTGGDFARLWARDGGKVLSPNLTSIVDVEIRVEGAGSQLDLGKLTNVNQTNITAVNGGKLALPLVTGYTGPTTYNGLLQASGAGALLDLTTFTSFAGGNGRSTWVWAQGGGKVDLGNVPQINGGATDIRSENPGSVVDFSSLTSWTHTGGDTSRLWARGQGKVIIQAGGIDLTGVNVLVDGNGKIEGGEVRLLTGSILEAAGAVSTSFVNSAGLVAVPGGVNDIDFASDFTQNTAGQTRVRLLGANDLQQDQIAVAGKATLAGRLTVQLQNGFAPAALGDTFSVLTADSLTGNFEFGGVLVDSEKFLTPVVVGNGVLLLTALTGDANLDGKIDLNDFGVLKLNFGSGERLSEGNMNGDRTIDLNDFGLLKANFGRTDGPKLSDLAANAAPVPEPSAGLLLALGALGLFTQRLRRGCRAWQDATRYTTKG